MSALPSIAAVDAAIVAGEIALTEALGVPSRVPHPHPVAGKLMFSDLGPREDEIEALAQRKALSIGWDGKRRPVEHWRAWAWEQYRAQREIHRPRTVEELDAQIARLLADIERHPHSCDADPKIQIAWWRADIAALEAAKAALPAPALVMEAA